MYLDKLRILYTKDNISFTDLTNDLACFVTDSVLLEVQATDIIFVGFYKPINVMFFELEEKNTITNQLSLEYWHSKDLNWQPVSNFWDETKGLTRSGFLKWDRNQMFQIQENEINSKSLYWYRLKASTDQSEIKLRGLNIVFASDTDLEIEFPSITCSRYFMENEKSHIKIHISVKREIIQTLRNSGYIKNSQLVSPYHSNVTFPIIDNINAWDILDIGEIRQAAIYLALHKIFNNLSDQKDDYYQNKASFYWQSYQTALRLFYISIDENNNGIVDRKEKLSSTSKHLTR